MAINKRLIKSNDGGAAGVTGTDNFEPVLYTGTGSTQSITSLDFQPDLVWFKNRTGTNSHALVDSVRGRDKYIFSDLTNAEPASSAAGQDLVSFDSNGFTLGTPNNAGSTNTNGGSIVAWAWKAGGAAVSNTDGTITSTVSANQDAGFSIVKWTGDGNSSATVGHGLSSTPELLIAKSTSEANNWWTGVKDVNGVLQLDSTSSIISSGGTNGAIGIQSTYTSNVFGFLAGTSSVDNANKNGQNYIAYCFHSVDGYQKVGSYTGTGAPLTVTTGFEPRFVMYKSTTGATAWVIVDSARATTNPRNKYIFANSSDAEPATYSIMNFLSDGFELLDTGSTTNSVGNTYIYLAIA